MTALLLCAAIAAAGDDDYGTREAASKVLARLVRADPGRWGPPVAAAAGLDPSAEVRSRCGRLCGPYRNHLADTYRPPCSRWPCADWGLDAAGVMADDWRYWMGQVPCESGPGAETCSPGWSRYRRATELYVRSQIRSGRWTPADADTAVRKAWAAELALFMERYPDLVATAEAWSRP